MTYSPIALDLFACSGLASTGLEAAGFTIHGAVERDRDLADLYGHNHAIEPVCIDAIKVKPTRWKLKPRELDLLWASPPCQTFSKRSNVYTVNDNYCYMAFARHVRELRPKAIAIENVPAYADGTYHLILLPRLMKECGYQWTWGILNSADYAVPQTRKRYIAIASLYGKPTLPEPTHTRGRQFDLFRAPWIGWHEAIADLIPELPTTVVPTWLHPHVDYKRDRLIQKVGARKRPIQRTKSQPSWTVRALSHDGHWRQAIAVINGQPLSIEPRCFARFQSVPDSFQLPAHPVLAVKAIGNGVPCKLAEAVAHSCLQAIQQEQPYVA